MTRDTILVTGAGGFIGSHVVEQAVAEGARVRAFLRYTSGNNEGSLRFIDAAVRNQVEVIFGDLRDSGAVADAMRDCDVVLHLGALIAIPYSYVHPREVVETNVIGTLNVLEAARSCGVRRVVHTSTSETYGSAQTKPITESHPLAGQSPYSATKIGADQLAESYWRSFDCPVVTVRPFNTYGPRQSTRAVIPTIISQAMESDVIRLGNVQTSRDFTYVSDTARGMLLAAAAAEVEGQVFNLGSGQEISIENLVTLIGELLDRSLHIEQIAERTRPEKSEVQSLIASATRAKDSLRWEPTTDLRTGLQHTIEWITSHSAEMVAARYHV